jgi:hypothetical protein
MAMTYSGFGNGLPTVDSIERWPERAGLVALSPSRTTGQIVGNPAQPRKRRQLNGNAQAVLLAVEARQPRQILGGQREVGDRVLDSDLVRPAAQPGKFGIRQVADGHLASEGPAVQAITARTLATVNGGPARAATHRP